MKKKLDLPKSFKEVSRARTGEYWTVVIYSKKLNRTYLWKLDGVSENPTIIYDVSF